MSTPLLAVEDLEVRHGAVDAVRGFSLEVDRGEIVGLIGPNGAGKSSTLHAIMGLVRPTAGDVRLDGRSVVGRRPEDIARRGIALVPEGRRIFAELTVEENLRLGLAGRRARRGGGEDIRRVYELFPVVEEHRGRHAGALSGGQQQQLAIARALVSDPQVLLLDEPSLGLAPRMVDAVFVALQQIRDRGIAVLLVEQRAQRTIALADRSYVLSKGRLRVTLGPEAADDTETLVSAYFA
jgi:branched-chain amino acid transport system ATP-binding protein